MAVTAATPANIVVGAGDITVDGGAGGATTGNNVYRIEQEWFQPQLNGVKGALVGTDYLIREDGFMEFGLAEINATTVGIMLPAFTSSGGDPLTLDSDDTRRIPTSAYHDYVLTVPGLDSKSFAFQLDDALQTGNAEFEAADDGMLAPRITVRGSWDPADLTVSPHRIIITGLGS